MSLSIEELAAWREQLGPLGVWCATDALPVADAVDLAVQIESLGYGAMWLPETVGRDPFVHISHLADRTTTLTFSTGIANIFHRHPGVMLQAVNTLGEQTGGRFALAMGVSHQPMVEGLRGLSYDNPLSAMRSYLDGMDASLYMAPAPERTAPRLIAALGPKMLELAAERADGVHPYWTTPEHTALAREALGVDKLLCVEQKVVLTTDADQAHATANAALAMYADLPNYRNNWKRLGFTEEQIESRSPAFLDRVVAWGTADEIRARIDEHHRAGADHVCIQPLVAGHGFAVDRDALTTLAP